MTCQRVEGRRGWRAPSRLRLVKCWRPAEILCRTTGLLECAPHARECVALLDCAPARHVAAS